MNQFSQESLTMEIDSLSLIVNRNPSADSFGDLSDSNDEDFPSDDEMTEVINVLCFFCTEVFDSCKNCLDHLKEIHQFDMIQFCIEKKVDQIKYIKLVNYIRKFKTLFVGDFCELGDEYMKPELDDDPLLCFDMDYNMEEAGIVDEHLKKENEDLQEQLKDSRVLYRQMFSRFLDKETVDDGSIATRTEETDASYINSYSNYDIHHEMLNDRVRTEAYQLAINSAGMDGKTVLDLGCGTGILSMFAAKAGAKSVDAVDMANIAEDAVDIVRENNLSHIVKVHQGRLEQLKLPNDKFDFLVSEWMGYFLLFEGMIDSLLTARDRYLAQGGTMLPNRCTMHLCALDSRDVHQRYIGLWENVYGFTMKTIASKCYKQVPVMTCDPDMVATESATILDLDLYTCSSSDTNFKSSFTLMPKRTTSVTAVCGYFDAEFSRRGAENGCTVRLSTSPNEKPTHWKQAIFFLQRPLPAERGIPISGHISVARCSTDVRSLQIDLQLAGKKYSYTLE